MNVLGVMEAVRAVRNLAATKALSKEFGAWGADSRLALPIQVAGGAHNVHVGARVRLGPSCRLTAREGRIEIGDDCVFMGGAMLACWSEITFGKAVLISWGAQFADAHHASGDRTRPILDQGLDRSAPIRVGDGAWIGTNAVVMSGVTIGRNAVIGAGAVVRTDVPDYGTAVGVPARLVGEYDRSP